MCLYSILPLYSWYAGNIIVGYEKTIYTTSEVAGIVELCVIVYSPPSGEAPQMFTLSATTMDNTAGTYM